MDYIKANTKVFLDKIFNNLNSDLLNVSNYDLDHVCYRAETEETYTKTKNLFSNYGNLIAENVIRGRRIAIFKLNDPLVYKEYRIFCIEVSSPRRDIHFKEGFEHAEFVIQESFNDFLKKYSKIEFNKEAMSKEINPEIIRQYEDCAVKFHKGSLLSVVQN